MDGSTLKCYGKTTISVGPEPGMENDAPRSTVSWGQTYIHGEEFIFGYDWVQKNWPFSAKAAEGCKLVVLEFRDTHNHSS